MKRLSLYVATSIIMLCIAVPQTQAQWIINTPINLLSTTLPWDSTWIVANGGVLTIDPMQTLNVNGTLIVQPGGMVVLDVASNLDIYPTYGRMRFDDYDPFIGGASMAINNNAVMRVMPGTYVSMGVDSKIGFVGSGIIKIAPTGHFSMNNAHIANNGAGTGLIDCSETWPFRYGPGWFYNMNMSIHNDFNIMSGDLMYFIDGGNIKFDCFAATAPHDFNIAGIAKFGSNNAQFTFADCINMIYVAPTGALAVSSTIMDSVPNVAGDTGSIMDLWGATWHMRFHAAIKSQGAIYANSSTFDCTNNKYWNGLYVDGGTANLQITDCLFTDIDLNRNGIGMSNATNPTNIISRTTIQCPLGPVGNSANGIKIASVLPSRSVLKLVCSDINGFGTGIGSMNSDLTIDGADVYVNNVGMNMTYSTAYIRNSFIRNNYSNGIVLNNVAPAAPQFDMSKSSVVGNQGYQFSLNGTTGVFVDSCNVYYRTGNTTAPIVYANGSTAFMQRNWWGIVPTVPAQFVLAGGSVVNHLPEMAAPWIINRGCIYPKHNDIRLADPVEIPACIKVQNYPNPFNPSTTIEYSLPARTNVFLRVYNLVGEEIATLVNEVQAEGVHRVSFQAASNMASGVYIYEIKTSLGNTRGNMMLSK